jgi:succinoglycan biosynthesis transport protein ExoP
MNAGEVARVVWRRKFIAVLVLVIVGASGTLFLSRQHKVYEASATVALLPDNSSVGTVSIYGDMVKNLLPTYAQLVGSRTFLDTVARNLPFPTTSGALRSHVHATAISGAGVMKLVASSEIPSEAAAIASATSDAFLSQLGNNGIVILKVIDDPRVPDAPVSPKPHLIIAATAILAIALAITAALVWERVFGRVHDAKELGEATNAPVLGVLPDERGLRSQVKLVIGDAGLVRLEESLRTLQTNLMFVMGEADTRSVAITSLSPEEGKSTVCSNIAVMVAELGFRVLLVDCDVHRPKQHELFGLDNSVGLSSTIRDNVPLAAVPQSTNFLGLSVVTAGPPLQDRRQEIALYQHLPRFAELADVLIVDTPPLRASADVRLLAASVGSVVLVVRSGSAANRELHDAVDALRVLDTRVLGTVLTRSKDAAAGSSTAYYGYRRENVENTVG